MVAQLEGMELYSITSSSVTLFVPIFKGPLSVPGFLLYVQYLTGCQESNPICCDCTVGTCLVAGVGGMELFY